MRFQARPDGTIRRRHDLRSAEKDHFDIAEREECVIIGRNADFILKDRDDVLNVFIHGNMPEKVKRICGLYNVTEQEAIKMTEDIDKRRM